MKELAKGLHRWTARHPSWHPADGFGAEVASFALETKDKHLLLVDPLPTLQPLLEQRPKAILTTHGQPVLSGATDALSKAINNDPWFRRG
jgi:hypothetical protein